ATPAALVQSTCWAAQPEAEALAMVFRPVAHDVRNQASLVIGGHRHPLPGRPGDVDPMDKRVASQHDVVHVAVRNPSKIVHREADSPDQRWHAASGAQSSPKRWLEELRQLVC